MQKHPPRHNLDAKVHVIGFTRPLQSMRCGEAEIRTFADAFVIDGSVYPFDFSRIPRGRGTLSHCVDSADRNVRRSGEELCFRGCKVQHLFLHARPDARLERLCVRTCKFLAGIQFILHRTDKGHGLGQVPVICRPPPAFHQAAQASVIFHQTPIMWNLALRFRFIDRLKRHNRFHLTKMIVDLTLQILAQPSQRTALLGKLRSRTFNIAKKCSIFLPRSHRKRHTLHSMLGTRACPQIQTV